MLAGSRLAASTASVVANHRGGGQSGKPALAEIGRDREFCGEKREFGPDSRSVGRCIDTAQAENGIADDDVAMTVVLLLGLRSDCSNNAASMMEGTRSL